MSFAGVYGGEVDSILCSPTPGLGGGVGGGGDIAQGPITAACFGCCCCWLAFRPLKTFWRFRSFGPPKPRDVCLSNLRSPPISDTIDGGDASRPLLPASPSAPERIAVMSSDFFLRPAQARFSRLPAPDDELVAGESGGGVAGPAGRARLWPMATAGAGREVVGEYWDERASGRNRCLVDEECEDAERSEVMISE